MTSEYFVIARGPDEAKALVTWRGPDVWWDTRGAAHLAAARTTGKHVYKVTIEIERDGL